MIKSALELLGQQGKDLSEIDFPGKALLGTSIHAVKYKPNQYRRSQDHLIEAVDAITSVPFHFRYPQEGGKVIIVLSQSEMRELPRFVWLKLENNLWVGWVRNRIVESRWRKLRGWKKGEGKVLALGLNIGSQAA